jgi:hypothetical protein
VGFIAGDQQQFAPCPRPPAHHLPPSPRIINLKPSHARLSWCRPPRTDKRTSLAVTPRRRVHSQSAGPKYYPLIQRHCSCPCQTRPMMALDIESLDADPQKDYDYKSRCEELEAALNETRSALDEFQISSRELEAELEKELENMERQYKDAKRQKERLKMESDDWKVCFWRVGLLTSRTSFSKPRRSRHRRPMRCKRKSMHCARRKS